MPNKSETRTDRVAVDLLVGPPSRAQSSRSRRIDINEEIRAPGRPFWGVSGLCFVNITTGFGEKEHRGTMLLRIVIIITLYSYAKVSHRSSVGRRRICDGYFLAVEN